MVKTKNILIKRSNEEIRKDLKSYNFQYFILIFIGIIFLLIGELLRSIFFLGFGILYFILAGHMITYSRTDKIILEIRGKKKMTNKDKINLKDYQKMIKDKDEKLIFYKGVIKILQIEVKLLTIAFIIFLFLAIINLIK